MSEQKHTPGELGFYYIQRSDLNPHGTYAIIEASDLDVPPEQRFHLAEVTGWGDGSPNNRKVPAQVNLFVAAPDMLDALKAAKELADVMGGLSGGRSDDEWIWAAQAKINSALAKAEGKT